MKDIIVALIALVGTLGGSLSGILTNYRLHELEKKVDKHNNFAEKIPLIQEQLKVANHRIEDLEMEVHK